MQPTGEALLGWVGREDGIVLPLFEDGPWGGGAEEVLCMIAFVSCIDNGSTLNAIYWDIRNAVRTNTEVLKAKIKTDVFPKLYFK